MIKLFNTPKNIIDTSNFEHLLHGSVVEKFEENFRNFVGAKYSCSINSATNAIFLLFLNKNITVRIPSVIPPVVCNALLTSGNKIEFIDNIEWVGHSYVLHDFGDYKIIDSAQKVERDQFSREANDQDLMFFSFYPTKPIGSCDGGIIVSNSKEKIEWLKMATLNGMKFAKNNWERQICFPGYKMYLNSVQAQMANESLRVLEDKQDKLLNICYFYNKKLGLENNSLHLYRINVRNRKEFIQVLTDNGVEHGIHYKAMHLNAVYNSDIVVLPKSEIEDLTTISLPFNENLQKYELEKICNLVDKHAIRN